MQPATAGDSLIGYVLADKYRVLRQIGRGGMGVVYEAEHVQLGKRVAIKLMLEKYRDDSEAIVRFQREAYAASRIGNPHIIDVVDLGTAPDGRAFVVMELLNGVPLTELIRLGPMPPWRAVSIIRKEKRRSSAEVPSVRFTAGQEWHELLSYVPAEPPSSPEQDAVASEILAAIAELSEREQDMLYDYVNDVPSAETGKALGISGGRVRQVWKQIFAKLRSKV